MKPNFHRIHLPAMNAIASETNPKIEQCLADAVEEELLASMLA